MNSIGFLGLAIVGGMLGNFLMTVALFALREWGRSRRDPFVRLTRSPNPFVRWWREQ